MTTRLVLAPSAPSQASELGAWPSGCFQGWKWSLTNTESKPTSSASREKSSNSRGPNCSAEALYPSFSTCRSCPMLDLGQHVFAEPAHIGGDFLGALAVEAEIDRDDAEFAQRPQIGRDRRIVAGAEPALAIVGLLGDRLAELGEAIGDPDLLRVPAGIARQLPAPPNAPLYPLQRVERVARVGADRIPGVAEPSGAPHRRAALAAGPDRPPL